MGKVRHVLEYVALRGALGVVDRLPIRVAVRLAERVGGLAFRLDRRRRRVAISNILAAGIVKEPRAAEAMALAASRHFGGMVIEGLRADDALPPGRWRTETELHVSPEAMRLMESPGQGIILVSGHIGSWELAAQTISLIKPVLGVARRLNNPMSDAVMQARLPGNRFRIVGKREVDPGRFLGALKAGEIVAFLFDQHARERGMMIDFLGRPASTHTSPALFHLVSGAPLCFGYVARLPDGRFALHMNDPIVWKRSGDKEKDLRGIMTRLTQELEAAIRLYPEQYLWGHRRWRV
jgi:KDO2-lipid IV(A) lauroyltransferase